MAKNKATFAGTAASIAPYWPISSTPPGRNNSAAMSWPMGVRRELHCRWPSRPGGLHRRPDLIKRKGSIGFWRRLHRRRWLVHLHKSHLHQLSGYLLHLVDEVDNALTRH